MSFGENLARKRRAKGWSQEDLAGKMGVSFQAVSAWERDESLPDAARLALLSRVLDGSLDHLFAEDDPHAWTLSDMAPNGEHMYTFVKAKAQALGFTQVLLCLPVMKKAHEGQIRKSRYLSPAPYMVHPLTMACHALAMGLNDDDVLSALLMHDVLEDTDVPEKDLPVSPRVLEAVRLVSYNSYPGDKEGIKPLYYENIRKHPLASLVKCIDRCNNLSCMADGFPRQKMAQYVTQTEQYVLPLLDVIRNVPEWNNAAWLLRYQIHALLETFKRML